MKVGLISDTHGYIGEDIYQYLTEVDEVWHAGDIGSLEVIDELRSRYKTRMVYGNIDNKDIRLLTELNQIFEVEGIKVFMTHIGNHPGRYTRRVNEIITDEKPQLYICGHSHILRVLPDHQNDLLHMNPGACGNHGFHSIRTMLRFEIESGKINNLEAIEIGYRGFR